jgi:hypothetical protein
VITTNVLKDNERQKNSDAPYAWRRYAPQLLELARLAVRARRLVSGCYHTRMERHYRGCLWSVVYWLFSLVSMAVWVLVVVGSRTERRSVWPPCAVPSGDLPR